MINSVGSNYVDEVLPEFRKKTLDATCLFFTSYFFRAEGMDGDHSKVPVNFYNDGLSEAETHGDRATARRQTRRAFVHIDVSLAELQPMDSLIAWIPLNISTLKMTLEKIISLVKENGIFGFVFIDNRNDQNFLSEDILKHLYPYSILYFDKTQLGIGTAQEIRVVGQKSTITLNSGFPLEFVPANETKAIDNGWDPYFEYTQFIKDWYWTKCGARLFSTSDQINVLDAGCGAGPDTKYILYEYPNSHVLGIHSVPEAEKYILPFLSDNAKSRFTFQCQDLTQYAFPEQYFDFIVSSNVLSFIDKTDATHIMEKMIASLKPGGVIVLTLFGEKNKIEGTQSTFTIKEAKTIFKELNIFSMQDRYRLETRKNPPQPQHNIIIIAQKPINL